MARVNKSLWEDSDKGIEIPLNFKILLRRFSIPL
jgi:hypothetical protein